MSQVTPRRKVKLLLGAPPAATLHLLDEHLLSYPTLPFQPEPVTEDPNATRIEDYLGPGTLPSISTFDPQATATPLSNDGSFAILDRQKGKKISETEDSRFKPVPIPTWRVLPLRKPPLHTGFTQRIYDPTPSMYQWKEDNDEPSTIADEMIGVETSQAAEIEASLPPPLSPRTPHLSFEDNDGSTEPNSSLELERSYAVHNMPTSQVQQRTSPPPPGSDDSLKEGGGVGMQSEEQATTFYEEDTQPPPLPPIPIKKITDLEDLPSAKQVSNRYRTHTATILVGIMKVESQTIKTKYQNERNPSGEVELMTFTVGDYTTSGLQVKIWLPVKARQPYLQQKVENPSLVSGLAKCRYLARGDIALFQDLALSQFRGLVAANSLRNERSKVTLVYREKRGFRADLSDPVDTAVERVRRVREWVRSYVGYDEDGIRDDDTRESL